MIVCDFAGKVFGIESNYYIAEVEYREGEEEEDEEDEEVNTESIKFIYNSERVSMSFGDILIFWYYIWQQLDYSSGFWVVFVKRQNLLVVGSGLYM